MKKLIERLERIFPKIEIYFPTEEFNGGYDINPEHVITWSKFLIELDRNGLCIRDKKGDNK